MGRWSFWFIGGVHGGYDEERSTAYYSYLFIRADHDNYVMGSDRWFVSKILCTTSRVSFDGQPERSVKSERSSRDEYNSKSHLMVGDTGRVKGTKRCPKKAG